MGCIFQWVVQEDLSEVVAFEENPKGSPEFNHETICRKNIPVKEMERCKVPEAEACSDSSRNIKKVFVARKRVYYMQDYVCIVFGKDGGN